MALARGALSKHGFPRGFRYTPKHEELITLLADRIRGRPMAPQVGRVFNDVRILDYHPQDLYERYRSYAEAGCIYFFSWRESVPSSAGSTKKKATSEAPAEDKKWRPTRTGNGGGWKPSGGAKVFQKPLNEGGAVVVGRMVTMVFYERVREGVHLKTHWGVHEFTVLLGPDKYSKLAVYRLYKVKNGGANKQRRNQPAANVVVPPVHRAPDVAVRQQNPPSTSSSVVASTSCSAGTSASSAQALFAAASTSPSTSQEQQMPPLVSTGQVQQFHDQYAFGLPPLPLAAIPPLVTDYSGFAAPSEHGTAPPAMMMNQFGTTLSPPAAASAPAAMSPPQVVVPPPPQPVVQPPEDCNMDAMLSGFSDEEDCNMDAMLSALSDGQDCNMDAMLSALSDEVAAGADIILPPSSDGDQVFFSLDELCGTDCPFGDVNNNQAAF